MSAILKTSRARVALKTSKAYQETVYGHPLSSVHGPGFPKVGCTWSGTLKLFLLFAGLAVACLKISKRIEFINSISWALLLAAVSLPVYFLYLINTVQIIYHQNQSSKGAVYLYSGLRKFFFVVLRVLHPLFFAVLPFFVLSENFRNAPTLNAMSLYIFKAEFSTLSLLDVFVSFIFGWLLHLLLCIEFYFPARHPGISNPLLPSSSGSGKSQVLLYRLFNSISISPLEVGCDGVMILAMCLLACAKLSGDPISVWWVVKSPLSGSDSPVPITSWWEVMCPSLVCVLYWSINYFYHARQAKIDDAQRMLEELSKQKDNGFPLPSDQFMVKGYGSNFFVCIFVGFFYLIDLGAISFLTYILDGKYTISDEYYALFLFLFGALNLLMLCAATYYAEEIKPNQSVAPAQKAGRVDAAYD